MGSILVTGGAGYIGSHVVKALCDVGNEVVVFDNFSLGLKQNIDPRVKEVVEGDLRNPADLKRLFKRKFSAVFHFAAWKAAGESMQDPGKYALNNISGTLNLLNAMVAHNITNFIFSSSAAVYGAPRYVPIDEKHPLNPENYYGYTKLAIEENLKWYSKLKGVRFAALRYFNATGYDISGFPNGKEQNPANLCPIVMETASGMRHEMHIFGDDYPTHDGTCIRDYIHVNDLATAHLQAMDYIQKEQQDLIVNLGTGKGISVLEMVQKTENITGQKVAYKIAPRRPGDPAELIASSLLAKELLGWQAQYSDIETIIKTMANIYIVS